jgi:uncharacterized membrane protein YoaK (UPF0700 family)
MPPPKPPETKRIITLLLLLSATTGLVDAVSVLGLGKVFTANMTGNIVFLGFAIAGAEGFAWPSFLVAILFFLGGAAVAGRLGQAVGPARLRHWLLSAALIEAGLLGAAALVAIGHDMHAKASISLYAIIALTALAMGLRNATVRQMKVPDLTTTVLTLTLTGLAADSPVAGGVNPNWRRRIGSVLSILVGAAVGGWLLLHVGPAIPLALAAVVVLVATFTLACEAEA